MAESCHRTCPLHFLKQLSLVFCLWRLNMTDHIFTGHVSKTYFSPGEGNGNPLQLFLPGEFHGQRSLADYSPWGCNESETTEQLVYIYITHIYISHICVCIEYIHTYVYIPFLCAPEINIINQLDLKKTQKVLFKHRINCVSHQSGDLVTQVSQPAW